MFKGEDAILLPASIPEDQVNQKVENVLGVLGRVHVDKRGHFTIEPRDKLGSFMTDVSLDGQIRKNSDGYEVSIAYNCAPSMVTWILAIVLLVTTCLGVLVILLPMVDKGKVRQGVRGALLDLEDVFGKAPGART